MGRGYIFCKVSKKNSILFVFSGFSHTLLPMISPPSATAAASIAAAGGVGPAACGSPVASPGGSAAALVAAGAALAGSYHTLRGLVPIVTCPRVIRYVGSCLPLRAGSGGLHVAQGGGGATIWLRSFSCGPQPLRERHNCLCRGKKSAFCLVLSPTWTTFAPY